MCRLFSERHCIGFALLCGKWSHTWWLNTVCISYVSRTWVRPARASLGALLRAAVKVLAARCLPSSFRLLAESGSLRLHSPCLHFLVDWASPTDGSRFLVPYHTASCASINITLQSQQENLCLQEGHTSSFKNFYQIKAGLHRVILIWLTQNQLIWGINYIFKIPSSLSYVLT